MNYSGKTELDPALLGEARGAALKLWEYCEERNWAGYDPYDALNSRLLRGVGLFTAKWPRLIATQLLKRCPVNVRPLLGIPQTQNPKGLGLFISAAVRLARLGLISNKEVEGLVGQLLALRSPNCRDWCWGYPFPWQTRGILFPRWQPNIICTTFSANSLLDAYELTGDKGLLEKASSAAEFVLQNFHCKEGYFTYTALSRGKVHNASLLGAALLCRVAAASGKEKYLAPAFEATRNSVNQQYPDGSWDYGDSDNPPQRWRDNFHTGFNLLALDAISRFGGTEEFDESMRRGFEYYLANFFERDGAPKYFNNRAYPLDIHSASQSIITLIELKRMDPRNVELAAKVFQWAMRNLQAPDGSFYYQKHANWTNKLSYMRWSQAWMLLGLATLLSGPMAELVKSSGEFRGTVATK